MILSDFENYFKRFHSFKDLVRSPLIWLSLLAAFLYSSWPWAYLLDPSVGRNSLASELEAPHRPYNWLFIIMDVLTGLILFAIGIWQLRKRQHWISPAAIWGYLLFGLLVAVAALTPLVCDPTTQQCAPLIHNYPLLIHGIASIGSVLFLLFALTGVTYRAHQKHATSWGATVLSILLLGWLFFGVASLSSLKWHTHRGNIVQDFFITLCSLSIIAVVVAVEANHIALKD
jgi:hypothetical protein